MLSHKLTMKTLLIFWVLVTVAYAAQHFLENDDIINTVNKAKTTWKAGKNFDPSIKKDYSKNLLGLWKRKGEKTPLKTIEDFDVSEIPTSFDARTKWSFCNALQEIRDQGPCGSCWAVSSSSAFTDRLCIATNGTFNSHLAAQELIACCTECGGGCQGGWPILAWQYFYEHGLVTGGDYHSKEGCQPYKLRPCEHHMTGKRPKCRKQYKPTPKCKTMCYNKGYKTTYNDDNHKSGGDSYYMEGVEAIQADIMKNGPVVASFDVFEDFFSYKTGVYQHTTGEPVSGHAVKVIGWGVENEVPFWLVANSWNTDWGDNGHFKMLRGNDECGFESGVTGGPV